MAKISKWESDLWECISQGDGSTCPVYNSCDVRLKNGWCLSDNKEHLKQVISAEFDYRNYEFMNHVTPGGGKIFRLIEKLANKYLKIGEISGPPVPTNLICFFDRNNPIEVREVKLKNSRGAVLSFDDKWLIYLNRDETVCGKRDTLFHEAFHIAAHTKTTPVFRKRGAGDRGIFNELLADHFSASVLMPRQFIQKEWERTNNLDKLAEIFIVSKEAIWVRLKLLHMIE